MFMFNQEIVIQHIPMNNGNEIFFSFFVHQYVMTMDIRQARIICHIKSRTKVLK